MTRRALLHLLSLCGIAPLLPACLPVCPVEAFEVSADGQGQWGEVVYRCEWPNG